MMRASSIRSATTGKYEPERKVTRAEFMRYVNRAFHFTEQASISYSDVQSNSWYYDTVRIARSTATSTAPATAG